MLRLVRFARILIVVWRYGLDEIALSSLKHPSLVHALRWRARIAGWTRPRGERLRCALQDLGPIFVKFGQLLSTRRDLLPADLADALAQLQDQVAPIDPDLAIAEIERGLNAPLNAVFSSFTRTPQASASIAQVHFAVLRADCSSIEWAGREVAVKVLRPNMRGLIDKDLALLDLAARWVERLWRDGRRLRPSAVVAQFRQVLYDELDLLREAGNAAQIGRNFAHSPLLRVPHMLWDFCAENVLVMEKMSGVPIGHIERLRAAGIDLKELSAHGVEIFFTQVLRDGFFHADMHPGNIYVGTEGADRGRYIALDFGIVGTLTDNDKRYLAQNFLGFFRRDYRSIALAHVESGWVPAGTRVDELESAIRTVCEPIANKPLKDISFGQILLRLFAASRRFNVHIQPQLVLLQKTLLNVEGLGRQLNPELDLWQTAKPLLERWRAEQMSWRSMAKRLRDQRPQWLLRLSELPQLTHRLLAVDERQSVWMAELRAMRHLQERRLRLLRLAVIGLMIVVTLSLWTFFGLPHPWRNG